MSNILVISGHPSIKDSLANKTILNEVATQLPEAEIVYLDQLYPNFTFDIALEQSRLAKVDIIVWQFPIFWYNVPSLMKKWIEDVFTYGFAYGSTGGALQGKKIILSFTTGGAKEKYVGELDIQKFLEGHKATAMLCGMEWQDIVFSGGYILLNPDEEKTTELVNKAKSHAKQLVEQIKRLK